MITIDKTFDGKKVNATKDDMIEVQLAENPTTGNLWKIESFDDELLEYNHEDFKLASNASGSGGMKFYYFKVIRNGVGELCINLGNPWEEDIVDSFTVTIESN